MPSSTVLKPSPRSVALSTPTAEVAANGRCVIDIALNASGATEMAYTWHDAGCEHGETV